MDRQTYRHAQHNTSFPYRSAVITGRNLIDTAFSFFFRKKEGKKEERTKNDIDLVKILHRMSDDVRR